MAPTTPPTSETDIVHLTASIHFPIKLNSSNFPVWHKQILSTLIGLDLHHFIEGTSKPPTSTSSEYSHWYRQDQILISALLGSCTEALQPLLLSANTSREAWKRLTTTYANNSRSRIISLKSKLTTNPKGSRMVAEFLQDMRSIADELALAQSPIDDEDLMIHTLNQLGNEYKTIVAALKVRDTPVSYSELYDKLVDFERLLKASEPSSPIPLTANYTHTQTNRPGSTTTNQRLQHRTTSRSQRSQWSKQPSFSNGPRTNRSNTFCQFCSINGHDTKDCRKLSCFLRENNVTISNEPVVNTTTTQFAPVQLPWLFDSGASNDITSDHSNLNPLSDYGGPDEIVLGDRTGPSQGGATHAGSERA